MIGLSIWCVGGGDMMMMERGGMVTPFRQFQFNRPNAPDAPDRSPSTTIVCISASLQLKEEGCLHREERGQKRSDCRNYEKR